MNQETKICQNCKKDFVIEPEDFEFYEKIKVPAPTWCPECRMVRKMNVRNERTLYKNKCDLCNKNLISMYPSDAKFKIYCSDCWWSDKWDPLNYCQEYSFSRPFFKQFKELFRYVPRANLYQTQAVDSNYSSWAINLKNCYLVFGGHHYEDSLYAGNSSFLKDCVDVVFGRQSEFCYEGTDITNCSNVFFSRHAEDCNHSYFLFNCRGLSECFGCINLRNKSHCIFNKQYSKEKYKDKIKQFNLGSFKNLLLIKEEIKKIFINCPNRYASIRNSINAVGDNIYNSKNCYRCFDVYNNIEDVRYSFFLPDNTKDSYDCDHTGLNTQFLYEVMSATNSYQAKFGIRNFQSQDVQYCDDCHNCSNLFACIGLRNKQYCILNKQYTPESYKETVERIKEHMNTMPYIDSKGRIYKYGEFFPPELSPFSYNETVAQEYFPLTKDQAIEQGYKWKDPEQRNLQITMKNADLPDHIKDVDDDIINQIIECEHQGKCNEQCTEAFKIIKSELDFYRKMNLPLPRLCPNCRHYQRIKQRNPLKLWKRKCVCKGNYGLQTTDNQQQTTNKYQNTIEHFHGDQPCPNEFETTYAPDRPEIVYCEKCYNAEVV